MPSENLSGPPERLIISRGRIWRQDLTAGQVSSSEVTTQQAGAILSMYSTDTTGLHLRLEPEGEEMPAPEGHHTHVETIDWTWRDLGLTNDDLIVDTTETNLVGISVVICASSFGHHPHYFTNHCVMSARVDAAQSTAFYNRPSHEVFGFCSEDETPHWTGRFCFNREPFSHTRDSLPSPRSMPLTLRGLIPTWQAQARLRLGFNTGPGELRPGDRVSLRLPTDEDTEEEGLYRRHWNDNFMSGYQDRGHLTIVEIYRTHVYGMSVNERGRGTFNIRMEFLGERQGRSWRQPMGSHLNTREAFDSSRAIYVTSHDVVGPPTRPGPRETALTRWQAERDEHECDDVCEDDGCEYSDYNAPYNDPDDEENPGIHDYNYRPQLVFFGDGPVFMGAELEISMRTYEERNQGAEYVNEKLGAHAHLKTDSSIHDYGFEIVSQPMSYDYWLDMFPVDFLNQLRALGGRPDRSCGMHVHVSRDGFSGPLHTFKWLKFMYRNRRFVSALARRESDEWASFEDTTQHRDMKHFAKGAYGGRRYAAVNAGNAHTFEVRVFASTLNPTKFMAAIGLVDASVEYTREISTTAILKEGAWDSKRFKGWLADKPKYDALRREINRLHA